MFSTYENYFSVEKSFPIEEIVLEISFDSDALDIYDKLVETATRYAVFRAK